MEQSTESGSPDQKRRPDWFFHISCGLLMAVVVLCPHPTHFYSKWSLEHSTDQFPVRTKNQVSFSDIYWKEWKKENYNDKHWIVREWPGITLVGLYLVACPLALLLLIKLVLASAFAQPFRAIRYFPLTVMFFYFAYYPLWIYLHEQIGWKYVVWVPEYFIGI